MIKCEGGQSIWGLNVGWGGFRLCDAVSRKWCNIELRWHWYEVIYALSIATKVDDLEWSWMIAQMSAIVSCPELLLYFVTVQFICIHQLHMSDCWHAEVWPRYPATKRFAQAVGARTYHKQEIRCVEHGICLIAEFTSPWLNCAAILAIQP